MGSLCSQVLPACQPQNNSIVQSHVFPGRASVTADRARQGRSIEGEASHYLALPGAQPTAVRQTLCDLPPAFLFGWPAQRQMGLQQKWADCWKSGQAGSYSHLADHHPMLMQAAAPLQLSSRTSVCCTPKFKTTIRDCTRCAAECRQMLILEEASLAGICCTAACVQCKLGDIVLSDIVPAAASWQLTSLLSIAGRPTGVQRGRAPPQHTQVLQVVISIICREHLSDSNGQGNVWCTSAA